MSSLLESGRVTHPSTETIEGQLALLVEHPALRSSRRLVSFLQFVVRQTLAGSADQLKERTIGVEVFDRNPDYDTSNDHIVRTAASELRKRLAVYYRDDAHRTQLRIDIPVGSYVPQFTVPNPDGSTGKSLSDKSTEKNIVETNGQPTDGLASGMIVEKKRVGHTWLRLVVASLSAIVLALLALNTIRTKESSQSLFWKPLTGGSRSVLLVLGDIPHGPPDPAPDKNADSPPSPQSAAPGFPSIPFGDAVAMNPVATVFDRKGMAVVIRQDSTTSFADLQNGPAVLLGAFNNDWSLRFSRLLRFSFAFDPDRQLIYIKDRRNPENRSWSVTSTDHVRFDWRRSNGRPLVDYALISRIVISETGKPMVIIGGLYVYGTEAASTLVTNPQFDGLTASLPLRHNSRVLQVIVQTSVTEGIPGPPKIVAYSEE